jgi:hypothetical protein
VEEIGPVAFVLGFGLRSLVFRFRRESLCPSELYECSLMHAEGGLSDSDGSGGRRRFVKTSMKITRAAYPGNTLTKVGNWGSGEGTLRSARRIIPHIAPAAKEEGRYWILLGRATHLARDGSFLTISSEDESRI